MSATHVTVKLNRSLVEAAREEASLLSRSLSAQIEHWARLGRAMEGAEATTHQRVRAALAGRPLPGPLPLEAGTPEEMTVALDAFAAVMADPPPEIVAAYAEIGRRPGAVGDDENGVLVRVGEDGVARPI